MKKILKIAGFTVLIIILIFNIYNIFSKYVLGNKVTNIFGYAYLTVKSNSMYPYLEKNDIIIIRLNKEYKVGDVITYKEGDNLITHRIVNIEDDKIITKGDANNITDQPITKDKVVGIVKKVL